MVDELKAVAKDILHILDSDIEILCNSPIHDRLRNVYKDSDREVVNSKSLQEVFVGKIVEDLNKKRQEILEERCKELGIEFTDMGTERKRLFKRFCSVHVGEEETIFYNDGSMDGLRVITFKTTYDGITDVVGEKVNTCCTLTYY